MIQIYDTTIDRYMEQQTHRKNYRWIDVTTDQKNYRWTDEMTV